jgi:ABC-type polysaccharide/polyol phosphate transport system ATPase subunit
VWWVRTERQEYLAKSLLSLVAGLCPPDTGTVTVNGRVAALLQMGAGFHPDLTGAENVQMYAALLGLSSAKTARVFDVIVEFSEIGDFIGEPLRTYSSGMSMRLAFSVAVHVDPDLLIIDEVLAVGDQAFQSKAWRKSWSQATRPYAFVRLAFDRSGAKAL